MISLYLHLPFCLSICPYCDFSRLIYQEELAEKYLDVLIKSLPKEIFKTIYIGGGTPSCIPIKQMLRLLESLQGKTTGEYTIEANIQDITEDKLKLFKEYGVNRLSLGVQSFEEKVLVNSQRFTDVSKIIELIELIKNYFTNFSIDLIYGLPFQDRTSFINDLKIVKKLKIPHISLYALTLSNNSIWGKKNISINDDFLADCYNDARVLLNDYDHYEISNFAKPGFYSEHNLSYWNYDDYHGRGLGASGKIGRYRYTFTSNLKDYISKQSLIEEVDLSIEEAMFEHLMMNFRLKKGLDYNKFQENFQKDFTLKYKKALDKNKAYLRFDSTSVAIKEEYFYLQNSILTDFLD